ncbi:hypothetical protein GCWU000324_00628 [Kingella oralis ATCC 51147]|uniref:Uncharacterized protein n=1 Tax=Kingella oralis ATCC 51147 TaxID=629741 RepID=C4GER9_9NEIS|nr:hypothetical protein GCWU000324_00628 [Kingella oralis ATCC 51147]
MICPQRFAVGIGSLKSRFNCFQAAYCRYNRPFFGSLKPYNPLFNKRFQP